MFFEVSGVPENETGRKGGAQPMPFFFPSFSSLPQRAPYRVFHHSFLPVPDLSVAVAPDLTGIADRGRPVEGALPRKDLFALFFPTLHPSPGTPGGFRKDGTE